MNAREAIKVLLSQTDRCKGGSDLHRAYYGAEEVAANKALVDYFFEATLLEFEAQELYAKLCKPGAPAVSGLKLLEQIMAAYGEVATGSTVKSMARATATAVKP